MGAIEQQVGREMDYEVDWGWQAENVRLPTHRLQYIAEDFACLHPVSKN